MSFGFSVGDFVACITLIKDVTQALNSSTGSVSEVTALSEMLDSLKQAIVFSAVAYQPSKDADAMPDFHALATTLTECVHDERKKCIHVLDGFIKSLEPYTEVFKKNSRFDLVRQAKKITWLFRKDDACQLEKSIRGRLEALRIYTDALSQLQSTNILSNIIDLRADITTMSAAIQQKGLQIQSHLGYPWEVNMTLEENVLLFDAIGRTVLLPMVLLSSLDDLHKILLMMYRNIHGKKKILRREYTLTDETSDGALIAKSNWTLTIRAGLQVSLNMVFPIPSCLDVHRCPRCEERILGKTLPGDRRRCHRCQLTFRIFDKERITESSSITSSTADNTKMLNTSSTATEAPCRAPCLRINTLDSPDQDFLFRNVHYHREVRITKTAHGTRANRAILLPQLKIEDLPPLHRAAAEGSVVRVEKLLAEGANIDFPLPYGTWLEVSRIPRLMWNVRGCSPLHIACWFGQLKVVNSLLKNGANILARDSDNHRALSYAIAGANPEKILFPLIRHGVEIAYRTISGWTPVLEACMFGTTVCFEYLLGQGADLEDRTRQGFTAIQLSALRGNEDIFDILMDEGADLGGTNDFGYSILHFAARGGSILITQRLLDLGCDPRGCDKRADEPLHIAVYLGHDQVCKLLLDYSAEVTPLHMAASREDLGRISMIQHEADTNATRAYGNTVLHSAVSSDHESTLRIILEQSIDVNAVNIFGSTPLHIATRWGHSNGIAALLQYGAEINARRSGPCPDKNTELDQCKGPTGCTPLMCACEHGNLTAVILLLDAGADLHAIRDNGDNALCCALIAGLSEIVELLLQRGADVEFLNSNGVTPLQQASKLGHDKIVKLLLKFGAENKLQESEDPAHLLQEGSEDFNPLQVLQVS